MKRGVSTTPSKDPFKEILERLDKDFKETVEKIDKIVKEAEESIRKIASPS